MPRRPKRPCAHAGCGTLVDGGYCDPHRKLLGREANSRRLGARARGYTGEWERESKAFLLEHPLCWYCEQYDRTTASQCVDHIVAHKGDMVLFWDRSNWRAACVPCNSRKAVEEEGAFGNARRTPV